MLKAQEKDKSTQLIIHVNNLYNLTQLIIKDILKTFQLVFMH